MSQAFTGGSSLRSPVAAAPVGAAVTRETIKARTMVSFLYIPSGPLTDQEACRLPHGIVLNRRDLPRGQEGVPPWDVRYQRSGLSASGMNRLCPKRDFPNSPIKAWVAGATRQSASALPPAGLTRGAFLGFTSITWYTL